MTSFNDGYGTTGAAHGAGQWCAPTNFATHGWLLGTQLLNVLGYVYYQPGAIFLIEQQFPGPNYTGVPSGNQDGLIPIEWWASWYDAVVTCVGNGVTVVECAGNGRENLDDPIYSTGNGGHWPFLPGNNSGAIIVGAGHVPGGSDVDRSRIENSSWGSNYGSRLDLQGWGENVVTCGYGYLYDDDGPNYYYTDQFAGTSSAAPIVAAAAAILQSIYKERGGCAPSDLGTALDPASVRSILVSTGSPQQDGTWPATQHIGPRPNLSAAVAALPDDFGACCIGTDCSITTAEGCSGDGGTFLGTEVDCGPPNPCLTCCVSPVRGDINMSGLPGEMGIDISDLVYLVNYMFKQGPEPTCFEEADVNATGELDIADLVYLVNYMFKQGLAPSAC